ncbi:hypothetical protein LINPERPRIM_LOCUS20649 [Linum perenne]
MKRPNPSRHTYFFGVYKKMVVRFQCSLNRIADIFQNNVSNGWVKLLQVLRN